MTGIGLGIGLGLVRRAGGVVPTDADPNFSSVSLLLHMDGENNSTTFTDSSPAPKTASRNGDVKIRTAQSKFGVASALFDGVDDALLYTGDAPFQFGTGDFTIELWFYAAKADQTQDFPRLLAKGNFGTVGGWNLVYFKADGGLGFDIYTPSAVFFSVGVAADNTWHHVAVTRQGTTVRTFLNGVLGASGTSSTDLADNLPLAIGAEPSIASDFKGYIDDVRITKGVAR